MAGDEELGKFSPARWREGGGGNEAEEEEEVEEEEEEEEKGETRGRATSSTHVG